MIQPAKQVNPKVKLVIKYPNWYDHYQGLGYNLRPNPSFSTEFTQTQAQEAYEIIMVARKKVF